MCFADKWFHTCGSFGSGIYRVDGECVGVTDGSYLFQPEFADVENKIAVENARVSAGSSLVCHGGTARPVDADRDQRRSLPPNRSTMNSRALTQRSVRSTSWSCPPALTRRSAGPRQPGRHRRPVATRGRPAGGDDERGPSARRCDRPGGQHAQTRRRARYLSSHEIPMVGALLTADELDYTHIPGFIRISPTTRTTPRRAAVTYRPARTSARPSWYMT